MTSKNLTTSNLVQHRGQAVYATSISVAEHFKKQHKSVLKKIASLEQETISRLHLAPREYIDERGKVQPMYELNRDAFSFIAMGFTGREADRWKLDYIEAFNAMEAYIRESFANPPRQSILHDKRQANRPMLDALVEARLDLGKQTSGVHYMSESKLCNGIVTGKFAKIDEKALSNADAELLRDVRKRNEAYLLAGLDYVTRKAKLSTFAIRSRTKQVTNG